MRVTFHFDVTLVTPGGVAGVADQKVILPIIRGFITHGQYAMIEAAATFGIQINAL